MGAIYPCLCYEDAHAAIDWLERAFGAQRHQVHEGDDGAIAHAELDYLWSFGTYAPATAAT